MDKEQGSKPEQDEAEPVRNALGAFNADEILDDPDELEPEKPHPPAINPDSPTSL
jgi:hypothetical protein